MTANNDIEGFLSLYDERVAGAAQRLRRVITDTLPDIREQLDIPAKMIAYSYGNSYSCMICTLIPSKKGLKLGFYKGMDLPDPQNLLQGTGKISRYVEIKDNVDEEALVALLKEALKAYQRRNEA